MVKLIDSYRIVLPEVEKFLPLSTICPQISAKLQLRIYCSGHHKVGAPRPLPPTLPPPLEILYLFLFNLQYPPLSLIDQKSLAHFCVQLFPGGEKPRTLQTQLLAFYHRAPPSQSASCRRVRVSSGTGTHSPAPPFLHRLLWESTVFPFSFWLFFLAPFTVFWVLWGFFQSSKCLVFLNPD